MDLSIHDYYALYNGGHHVVSNSRYLWRTINEPEAGGVFEQRRLRASYPNFQKKIVNIYTDYVLFGKPQIKPARFDILELTRDIIKHSLIGGSCYVVILEAGPKVYEGFRVKKNKETGIIEIEGNNDEKIILTSETATIIKPDTEPVEEPFSPEQLIECFWDTAKMSLIADSANINIAIYNFWSVLDTLVLQSAILNSTGPPVGNRKRVSPFEHIPSNQGEPPFSFVSPDTSPIERVRNEIKARIMEMAAIVGLTREFSEELHIEPSGLSLAFQMLDTNATILQIAKSATKCTNQAAKVDAQVNTGPEGSIILDPLLTPQADEQKLNKFKSIEDIRIDGIIKESQRQRINIVFADLSDEKRNELIKLVDNEGGLDSIGRPELDFNI